MPKGILEFALPGEEPEFIAAQKGGAMLGAIEDFQNYIRKEWKYGEHSDETHKMIDAFRSEFFNIFGEFLSQ